MAQAKVGDDVFGEDPTVNQLEKMAAELMGKEAALFVPSGTMANLVCILTHCGRGDEIILGDQSHIFIYEQGGSAALGGVHPRPVPNLPDGTLVLADIEAAVRPDNIHFPISRLLVLENTHNRCFGTPLTVDYMNRAGVMARRFGLKVHVDGARIFNAAVALNVPARDLAADADSISFCLSKGLGAPAGSMVCGSKDFIQKARRNRKVLGGGMRQAGILAAAGIVALTEMVDRLADDHANAKHLAQRLAAIPGLTVDPDAAATNIVYINIKKDGMTEQAFSKALADKGVFMLSTGPGRIRAVVQHHVSTSDIDQAIDIIQTVMAQ
jgi:threonine aldolase